MPEASILEQVMGNRREAGKSGAGAWVGWPVWAVGGLMLALLLGCGERDEPIADNSGEPAEQTYIIVASIHPLADLASQVTGPGFEVHTLLPAGATPHGFEPTADKIRLLGRADLILTVGLTLDPWADRAAATAGRDTPLLSMAEMLDREAVDAVAGELREVQINGEFGYDEHEHHDHDHDHDHGHDHDHHDHYHDHDGPDSHLWIDPVLVKQWVRQLRSELVTRFPARSDEIERNAAAVLASLEQLDAEFREQLAAVPKRELVTFHNAFDRLANRYGLEVVAHLTDADLEHGAEIRPGRWRQAVAAVRQYDLKVLYSEPQFPVRELASIRRETGVEVLTLDPLGHPRREGYRTYQETMRTNLETLVDGQSRTRYY
ncbi:metal ABC transporter substrate-binding protein [Phycisphaerales bacterium AB-hyl4]|uniref:Metal ABC transporter substrate-binding protein n=1 Tax=Natronomicrosphaera hydrolytica TaxID=3242702 RepID=A0ABV4U2T0_9BACT